MWRGRIQFAAFLTAVVFVHFGGRLDAAPVEASGREIWFGPRVDRKTGTGTRNDPFSGDVLGYALSGFVQGNRDFARSTNLTVRLLPGTYPIKHQRNPVAMLSDGIRLVGSGMDSTILKVVTAQNRQADFFVLTSPTNTTRVEVSDLTVDGSWGDPTVQAKKMGGIMVRAGEGALERVRAVGFGSIGDPDKDHTREVFVLAWRVPDQGRGGVRIRGCEVSGDSRGGPGGYAACLAVFGGGKSPDPAEPIVVVSGNRVTGVGNGTGINLASVHNVLVIDNEVVASRTGFHADSGQIHRVTIANNRFLDVAMGVSFGEHCCNGFTDFVVTGNLIELNDRWPAGEPARWRPSGVRIAGCVTNALIEGNTLRMAAGVSESGRRRLGGIWSITPNPKYPNVHIRSGANTLLDGLRDELGGAAAR